MADDSSTVDETSAIKTMLKQLRHDPTFADLTIICGTRSFKVHKAIVCAQSEWFKTACEASGCMDKSNDTIVLPRTHPRPFFALAGINDSEIVETMIDVFYASCDLSQKSLIQLIRLNVAATGYTSQTLHKACCDRFKSALDQPVAIMELVEAIKYASKFSALHRTERRLANAVVDHHLDWLSTDAGYDLVSRIPSFGKAVFRALFLDYNVARKPVLWPQASEEKDLVLKKSPTPTDTISSS